LCQKVFFEVGFSEVEAVVSIVLANFSHRRAFCVVCALDVLRVVSRLAQASPSSWRAIYGSCDQECLL